MGSLKMASYNFLTVQNALAENRIILIDVRNPSEVSKEGKIPGSYNIPIKEVEAAFKLSSQEFEEKYGFCLPEKDANNIVTHCMRGGRAGKAKEVMTSLGYNSVHVYKGSFTDWKQNGGEVEMASYNFLTVKNALAENRIILIDVRNPSEVSTEGKIPGSYNIPMKEVEAAFKLPSKEFEEKYGF